MDKTIFDFSTYKAYLLYRVGEKTQRRGIKSALAQALRCQPTYISQVVNGSAEFSLEQAEALNRFFSHSKVEGQLFLLLVLKDRAATAELKTVLQEQINELLSKRMVLTERLGESNTLTEEKKSIYYSSWHYAAVHMALTVSRLQSPLAIAKYLQIPRKKIAEALEFLVSAGLARRAGEKWKPTVSQIRIGRDSHNILKHHSNWRIRAIESLEKEELDDLHYSATLSISKADARHMKDRILELIKEMSSLIKNSEEEDVKCFAIDLFALGR